MKGLLSAITVAVDESRMQKERHMNGVQTYHVMPQSTQLFLKILIININLTKLANNPKLIFEI
jgi:hypothetical protein